MELKQLPITLVAIVRNAGGRLAPMVNKHKGIVSEVVVVDQSSTDGTYEEALECADFVVKRFNKGKCEGDRNFAFDLGRQPWILNLDDDEHLSDELIEKLPSLLEMGADVIWFARKNIIDGVDCSPLMGKDPQCRLFKRGSVKWHDETHTYGEPARGAPVLYSNLEIVHTRTHEGIKATHQRRLKALEPQAVKKEKAFLGYLEEFLRTGEAPRA